MVSGEECVYVEGRSVEFVFLGFLLLEYFSKKCELFIFDYRKPITQTCIFFTIHVSQYLVTIEIGRAHV